MKKRISLSEAQLHNLIKESVKSVLREGKVKTINHVVKQSAVSKLESELEEVLRGIKNGMSYEDALYKMRKALISFGNSEIRNLSGDVTAQDYEPEDWYERNEHGDFDSF